ncbi:MAG: hypothetical protein P8Y44_10275 [Acidobacteriota bacterium]
MNGEISFRVFDPRGRIVPLLRDSESNLESKARQVFGHPVDIRIQKRPLRAILEAEDSADSDTETWCVADLTRERSATATLSKLVTGVARAQLNSIVVVTRADILNRPKFQSVVFGSGAPRGRIRVVIEDPGEAVSAGKLLPQVEELFRADKDAATERERGEEREARHPPFLLASQMIRNRQSGRLDAKRIAAVLDLPVSRIAEIVGVTKQALSQTPDSKKIQPALFPFEKITRAMIFADSDIEQFRYWLQSPSNDLPALDGAHMSPHQIIERGHPEVVAALVENRLAGQPG